jgi:hypothetical protein
MKIPGRKAINSKASSAVRSGNLWTGLAIGLAIGLSIGFVLGATVGVSPLSQLSSAAATADGNGVAGGQPCKVCEEDKYWYMRRRVPFLGHLSAGWLEQFHACLPARMRYQFTMNGTIGVSGSPPSDEGGPAKLHPDVGGPGQIYSPLNERKDLFGARKGSSIIWSKALLDYLIGEVEQGKDISCDDYPESALDVGWTLKLLGAGMNDRLLVGGSISPWVEAVALHANVGQVTTVDFQAPYCDNCHPRLRTMGMETLMLRSTPAGYSIIVSYSSIEHDGLGRYGDPMDPYGDQHAMNEFWNLLQDDGILLLGVPLWPDDQLAHLLARLYGPIRLPWLINGWEYLGCVNRGVWSTLVPFKEDWGWHPIIALRKKTSPNSDVGRRTCTLNCTDSTKVSNKLLQFPACRPSDGCGDDLSRHWPRLDLYPRLPGLPVDVDARNLREPVAK